MLNSLKQTSLEIKRDNYKLVICSLYNLITIYLYKWICFFIRNKCLIWNINFNKSLSSQLPKSGTIR